MDRAFALLASPQWLGASLGLLALVELADAFRLAGGELGWATDPVRAIAVALVGASAVAVAAERLLPIIQGVGGRGLRRTMRPDLMVPASAISTRLTARLDRSGGLIEGRAAAVGVVLLFVGLLVYGGWPLWQAKGLARAGEMSLEVGESTEIAQTQVEGVGVAANLGGVRYQLMGFDPGGTVTGGTGVAHATLQMTDITTGSVYEASVWEGAPAWLGRYQLFLSGTEPSERLSGVAVTVTERTTGRRFDINLPVGVPVSDPAGPGKFQIQKLEEAFLEGQGPAVTGTVTVGDRQSAFWLYPDSPGFDAKHRQGRYTIAFRSMLRGDRVHFYLGSAEPNNPIPFALGAMLLGFVLLFMGPQRTLVLRGTEFGELGAVSSLNDGESLIVWMDDEMSQDDGPEGGGES